MRTRSRDAEKSQTRRCRVLNRPHHAAVYATLRPAHLCVCERVRVHVCERVRVHVCERVRVHVCERVRVHVCERVRVQGGAKELEKESQSCGGL